MTDARTHEVEAVGRALQLSSYVDAVVRTAVDRALRELFGVTPAVPFHWARRPAADGCVALHVRVGEGPSALDIDLSVPDASRWFSGQTFSAALRRRPDGVDPATDPDLAPLLRRLRGQLARQDLEGTWTRALDALDREARFRGVSDHMLRQVSPREALVRLGFRCNQRCGFCWQDRGWPEAPASFYAEWIDAIAASGRTRVTLSGGEPTIHPDFLALVRRAAGAGLWVEAQSNAIQLARDGFAAEARAAGLRSVFVSLHAHRAGVSDDMTQAPRTHARTVTGIERALDAGLLVSLNCVVEQRNHALLAEHAAFIVERFGPRSGHGDGVCWVEYSHPSNYHAHAEWQRRAVPLDLVRPHLRAAMDTLEAAGVPVSAVGTCGFPPCVLGRPIAHLRRMERAAEEEHDRDGRTFAAACSRCLHQPHCLGVRNEYVALFGDRGIEPIS